MKRHLIIILYSAFVLLAQSVAAQNGRENWFPNKGNVGIGTRSPSADLEVVGDVKVTHDISAADITVVGLNGTNLNISQDATIGRNLKVSGNVGIGVSSPVEKLEVSGNVKVSQNVTSDKIISGDGTFSRSLAVTQNFNVSGKVGVGVPSPVEKLEVAGNAKVSQTLFSDKINAGDGAFSRSVAITQNLSVNGLTGFGIASPVEKLEVGGNAKVSQTLFSDKINSGDGVFSRSVSVTQNFNVNGLTGLGVATPTEKLEVAGNIKSTGDVTGVNIRGDKGFFNSLESNGNLVINGNVGIGVPSPVEKLEVGGNIKATQGLFAQTADLAGNVTAGGTLSVAGNVGIGVAPGSNKLAVAGDTYVNGMLTAENLTVNHNLTLQGSFSTPGPIGIGVASPLALLHVSGDGKFDGNVTANKIIVNAIEIAGANSNGGSGLNLGDNLVVNGSIAIGTSKVEGFKLSVNGKIRASDIIKVYPESQWSDFVFEKDYKLRPLEEVETFIGKKGHLPDMPSAKEVAKDGIDLGGMDAKLLQKIEELTLYMIEMKKENEILKKEVKALKVKSSHSK